MNTDAQKAFAANQRLGSNEVIRLLEQGVVGADATRTAGLAQATTLRDAKARSLTREQTLLARKHGEAGHPRIAEAAQRLLASQQFRQELSMAKTAAETPLPEAERDVFTLHGFVRRQKDQVPLPGLSVALTDAQGNWQRAFGFACTDQRGYFLLKIKGAANQDVPGVAAGRGSFQLRVFDKQGRGVFTDKEPVRPELGDIDYRILLLGDDNIDCGCAPPPVVDGAKPEPTGPTQPLTPVTGDTQNPVVTPAGGNPRPSAKKPAAKKTNKKS